MATSIDTDPCTKCKTEKTSKRYSGRQQDLYCIHFEEDHEELNKKINEFKNRRDSFRKTLRDKKVQLEEKNKPIMENIKQWERDSIKIIRQKAKELEESFLDNQDVHFDSMENSLRKLTNEFNSHREDVDVEDNLEIWGKELEKLTEQLNKQLNVTIQRTSTPLIYSIDLSISSQTIFLSPIDLNTKWKQNGITVAGGDGEGARLNKLSPEALCIDDDNETIYIADRHNHRIVECRRGEDNVRVVAGGKGAGKLNDQLNEPTDVLIDKRNDSLIISDWKNRRVMRWPRRNGTNGQKIISNIECWGIAMDNDGCLYVADTEKHDVRRWKIGDPNGTIVAGGNGKGGHRNQLDCPSYIFVDDNCSLYVSDSGNHRVMKWIKGAKEGVVVAGENGEGNKLTQLRSGRGVIVDHLEQVYVADRNNNRVIRWCKGATVGTVVVGGNGRGSQSYQFNKPIGLSFDRKGNLYVADRDNDRIQKFEIDFDHDC